MHFEFLVEDMSGKRALETLVPKLLDPSHTWKIISYRGIGKIPANLSRQTDPRKRILLAELPRLLKGYGKAFAHAPQSYSVVLVCDLDKRDCMVFRSELVQLLESCTPKPTTRFCIAIEEVEAWLLGDQNAIKIAYPKAKAAVLESYAYDSICGTWEVLADAVYAGGAKALKGLGRQSVGAEKHRWAESITPHMQIEANLSPSFRYFCSKVRELSVQGHAT